MENETSERKSLAAPAPIRRRVRIIAIVAAWILLPAATIAAVTLNLATKPVTGSAGPVLAPVRDASGLATDPVDIALGWGPGFDIFSPAWSGLVQRVDVEPGDPIAEGVVLGQIDGIERMFALTSIPFHRALSVGDTGPEVAELNAFLIRRGFSASEGDWYSWDTGLAVQAFAKSIGAPATLEFDPSWVVWAPDAAGIALDEIALVAGEAATPNTSIAMSAPILEWAQLVRPSSSSSSQTEPATPAARPEPGIVIAAAEGQMLKVGEASIALTESRDEVAPEGLTVLQGSLSAKSSIATGNLVRDVTDAVAVPTASLVSEGSVSCVLVRSDAGTNTAVIVTVLADAIGQTIVAGDLAAGQRVEVAVPSERRSCKS